MIHIVHPATGNTAVVPEETAAHFAGSGWISHAAHEQNKADAAAREAARAEAEAQEKAAADKAASKAGAAKGTGGEGS